MVKDFSHFKIHKLIGKGGMGEVYLAEDTILKRKVALKFLPAYDASDVTQELRFKREALAAAKLNHPNIITIYEYGSIEDKSFISMEYIEGESLAALLNRKKLSIFKVIRIILQICQGLGKSHKAGIIHRDLKPSNIMIDNDGVIKILDFGLAKLKGATKLTRAETTMGTLLYMSPEQVKGQEIDERSDIFSLGVIFYELLANRLPFEGNDFPAIAHSIISKNPVPLKHYRSNVPKGLQRLIDKALEKDPQRRYATIDLFVQDLLKEKRNLYWRMALATGNINLVKDKLKNIKAERKKRNRLVAVLSAAGVFIFLGAFLLSSFLIKNSGSDTLPIVDFSVATRPVGANVFVGGKFIGVSPIENYKINAGTYAVRLSKQNFFTLDSSIVISKERPSDFSIDLKAIARVSIDVDPPDAQIILNGRSMNALNLQNLEVLAGHHSITVSREGYKRKDDEFFLSPGLNQNLTYYLEKISNDVGNSGSLKISSVPPRAKVWLNNRYLGQTPYLAQNLRPGSSSVRVSKDKYENYTRSVNIVRGETAVLNAKLVPLRGTLKVSIKPGGTVQIDGNARQTNSVTRYDEKLSVGSHRLLVTHSQFGKWNRNIEIKPNQQSNINIDFNRMFTLTVTSNPVWAEIFVDGKSTGKQTPHQLILRIGQHAIEVRRAGYFSENGVEIINLEEDSRLNFRLRKN